MENIQDLELGTYQLGQHLCVHPPNKFLQLESMVLHSVSDSPLLESIEETLLQDDRLLTTFQHAPRLRRLSMPSSLWSNLNNVLISWSQLTHLTISWYMSPAVWEKLFPQCINLIFGIFYIEAEYLPAPAGPTNRLAHLVELTLMYSSSSSSGLAPPLLRNFHLPKLQTPSAWPVKFGRVISAR
jgi:hypothetical protein